MVFIYSWHLSNIPRRLDSGKGVAKGIPRKIKQTTRSIKLIRMKQETNVSEAIPYGQNWLGDVLQLGVDDWFIEE
jgi:hypothetical protein